jgi:hypothetical protein
VYVSEIVRNTLNPVWMPFEPDALAHLSHNMDGLHHHVSVAPLLSGTGFDIVVVRVRNYKMARRKSSALLGVIMADEDGLMLRKVTRTRESSDDCSVDAGDEMEDKAKRNIPAVQEVDPSVATGFYFSGIHQPKKQRGAFDFSDDEDAEGEASDAFPADGPVVPSASNALVSSFRLNNSSKRNDNSIVYEEEIFCFRFNIRELDPLPIGLTEISNLPLNTCLLEFNDRLYVKREVIELLVDMGVISVKHSRRKGSAIQLKEYSLHDGIDNLERIRALRKHIKDVTHGNAELKDQIKQRLMAAETTVQKDHLRTAVQDRIQALRRQIAEKKNALDRVKHIMHDERRTFETDIHIPKALLHMMQMSIRYKDEKQGILERRCEVLRAAHKIRSRQAMLVKELTTIYPIEYIGAGENAIRGIRVLNSDLTINGRGDEEQISTALGYIAHLTFMLSKYLHVNLRYKIVPYSSRSYMKDEINDPHGEYPLYRKGVERERFERAIFFLRKDVEQVTLFSSSAISTGWVSLMCDIFYCFVVALCSWARPDTRGPITGTTRYVDQGGNLVA